MKKKRVSKRNKIAWRKHVNIDDVEDFLEDQRLEERLGLKSSSNQDLFIIDKVSSEDVPILSKKERSKLKLANPRCFEILKPHTKVPDPIVKRNRVRTKEERKNKLVKLKEEERRAKGILQVKEIHSIKGKELYEKMKLNRPKRGEYSKDLWNIQENPKKIDGWISEEATVHNLRQTGTYLKKVVDTVTKKPSIIPTIEPPHPGMSYNPSFEDHQDLLKNISEKEQALIKRDQHLNRVTRHIRRKVGAGTRQNSWLQEMSQGLPIQKDKVNNKNKDESDVSDDEYKSINPPAKNKKKSLKQRRKQKEQLLKEKLSKMAKVEKKKVSDLHRLKFLKEQVNLVDDKILLNKQKRIKFAEIKKKGTKRLGAQKFEDRDLEFNMPGDITGTLRGVKKESNLLVDRFASLQKRNIIPPSSRIKAKKAKFKRYVKPGHKDDWKTTVAGIKPL